MDKKIIKLRTLNKEYFLDKQKKGKYFLRNKKTKKLKTYIE